MKISDLISLSESKSTANVAVVVGRFNPPTIGHYHLINSMTKWIKKHDDLDLQPQPIVVVIEGTESSKDKKRNPLSAADRIKYMTASGKVKGVKYVVAKNVFSAFRTLREDGLEPIAIGAGSDRSEEYKEILDKYFNKPNGDKITHYVMNIDRDEDEDNPFKDTGIEIDKVSATQARDATKHGDLEKFSQITGLSGETAKSMFNQIKDAMSS